MRAQGTAPVMPLTGNGYIIKGSQQSIPRYRPPGSGAAICRGCNLIFRPKLANHVVCPRCHHDGRRAREVRT